MRTRLDPLYNAFGAIGAGFILLTLLIQVVSIAGRFVHFSIDGYDAYAGYFLAAGSFFALAHTLRRGDHIRVTLIISRFHGRARVAIEIVCLGAATFLTGYFAWYSVKLAYGSWAYNDVSQNIDATPLWIPQISMALGMTALFMAFAEELIYVLRHRHLPAQQNPELARTE
ncbi:MAG: TRAP transporter small permease [Burkholderiaceae bacterium]|jgi:TRAP-type C4-dicarboxylate transport system permease small subunit|nr:TRAP transporter small permease [Burkholderiaceae bacterium]